MTTYGFTGPKVAEPPKDLLKELRAGRMTPQEFIRLAHDRAEAMATAGWRRFSGDPPPPEQTVNWKEPT